MKRSFSVILAVVLALVISVTGSGLMLVYCGHSQSISMTMDDMGGDSGCHKKAPCMTVTVMKLAPTSQASFQSIDFQQVALDLLAPIIPNWDLDIAGNELLGQSFVERLWHSPPRSYLSLLTTLII